MVDKQSYSSAIVSDNVRQLIEFVTMVILGGIISIFGTMANVINLIVFYRQGLHTTVNISFFSLAVADLGNLTLQQLYSLYINPLFVKLDLPIVYNQFQYITTSLNRAAFSRITCEITAFITAERCLCVVFPMHIKRLITPWKATVIISAIFVLTLLSQVQVYCTTYHTWRFYPALNRSLLGFRGTSQSEAVEAFTFLSHSILTLLAFMSVLIFTLILIYKLGQKSAWRQTANADQDKAKSMSKRDRATIRMVVLIACILIVTYTPTVLLSLTKFIVPEFSHMGKHSNLYYSVWKFAIMFEALNSSINVFLYYKMSSKYRNSFRELFSCVFNLPKSLE